MVWWESKEDSLAKTTKGPLSQKFFYFKKSFLVYESNGKVITRNMGRVLELLLLLLLLFFFKEDGMDSYKGHFRTALDMGC